MQTVKNITVPQHQTIGLTINLFLGSERNFCLPEDVFHALLLGTVLIASCERSFGRGLFSFSKHLPAGISFFPDEVSFSLSRYHVFFNFIHDGELKKIPLFSNK